MATVKVPTVGELRSSVKFYSLVTVTNAGGPGKIDTYPTLLLTTTGNLRKLRGLRNLETGQIIDSGLYELWVRYQQGLISELKQSVKIEIDNRVFKLASWEHVEEGRRQWIRIDVHEKR